MLLPQASWKEMKQTTLTNWLKPQIMKTCKVCGCEETIGTGSKQICGQCTEDFPDAKECKSCKRFYPDNTHFNPPGNLRCLPCVKRSLVQQEKNKLKRLVKKAVIPPLTPPSSPTNTKDEDKLETYITLKIGDKTIGKLLLIQDQVEN